MNALRIRPVAQRLTRPAVRTHATMNSKAFPDRDGKGFKKAWLSDPSTYPIILIMGGGLTWLCGMSFNALFTYKQGVDINPNNRGAIMKNYSSEHRVGVLETFLGGKIKTEGVGVDPAKWKAEKEAYSETKE
eukprot:Nitzschia sp. Nitz4//scaffold211_size37880//18297//18692//NITZ4_007706-RA/size37880-processed-gene-0.12-mRNA-1//-1//CDS//3329541979//1626//frame0